MNPDPSLVFLAIPIGIVAAAGVCVFLAWVVIRMGRGGF